MAVRHQGHVDYLTHGHLEHQEGAKIAEHVIPVSKANPSECKHANAGHDKSHVHGPHCGHPAVPHGNHTDYLVDGRLHHVHGDHCDDHGPVEVV
jgi:hypothetical protein